MKLMFSARVNASGKFTRPILTKQHVHGGCTTDRFKSFDADKIPMKMNVNRLPKNVKLISRAHSGVSYFEVAIHGCTSI